MSPAKHPTKKPAKKKAKAPRTAKGQRGSKSAKGAKAAKKKAKAPGAAAASPPKDVKHVPAPKAPKTPKPRDSHAPRAGKRPNAKVHELRTHEPAELEFQLKEKRKRIFELRFKSAVEEIGDTKELSRLKREVARILTIQNERRRAQEVAGA